MLVQICFQCSPAALQFSLDGSPVSSSFRRRSRPWHSFSAVFLPRVRECYGSPVSSCFARQIASFVEFAQVSVSNRIFRLTGHRIFCPHRIVRSGVTRIFRLTPEIFGVREGRCFLQFLTVISMGRKVRKTMCGVTRKWLSCLRFRRNLRIAGKALQISFSGYIDCSGG